MEITLIERVRDYVFGEQREKVFKTFLDTKTSKEYVVCEIYTLHGTIDISHRKGETVDVKV